MMVKAMVKRAIIIPIQTNLVTEIILTPKLTYLKHTKLYFTSQHNHAI